MSIVRIGLAETKNFAAGFDAIFGGRKAQPKKPALAARKVKPAKAKKKNAKKK